MENSIKILKKFQVSVSSDTHSVAMLKCECCSDYFGVILNKETDAEYYQEIKSVKDYMDFVNVFEVATGDYLPVLSLIKKKYSDKKIDKTMDKLFQLL